MTDSGDEWNPTTMRGRALKRQVSPERWARLVEESRRRVKLVDSVVTHKYAHDVSWREAYAAAGDGEARSSLRRWRTATEEFEGEPWECLLPGRIPPDRTIAAAIRSAARMLRRLNRSINTDSTRERLCEEFGEEGNVSDTWLRRVWAEAGLPYHPSADGAGEPVETEFFTGGTGLALLVAADAELGVFEGVAKRAQARGLETIAEQAKDPASIPASDESGRDDRGQFTAQYNQKRRAETPAGEADSRWLTDDEKRRGRELSTLTSMKMRQATLARKLFAMGATPLLTERRGFDGLDGPSGEWLGLLGGVAYMPATLDKALAELALLDVGDALWEQHAGVWHHVSARWQQGGPDWLRTILYVDGTADPYWTRAFARSGRVSRVGRIMPCLSRVAIHSGAGVPLLIETHVGAVALKRRLVPMLEQLNAAIGPEAAADRLTIVDAEAGSLATLRALHEQADVFVITPIKGLVQRHCTVSGEGDWQSFRERDRIREVIVDLPGPDRPEGPPPPDAATARWRGIQLARDDGRRPRTTLFVTNAAPEDLTTEQVVSRYLDRWPRQEQAFRDARNGGGLNRSHGYGGRRVQHCALEERRSRAKRSAELATKRYESALDTQSRLKAAATELDDAARQDVRKLARSHVEAAEKTVASRKVRQDKLASMPDVVYERDTTRDSIMTCLKVTVLSLIEFACQEYFGGVRMEWRTFIEQFVMLPVTVRRYEDRCVFQVHPNRRQPQRMEQLYIALEEINRRQIHRGDELLVFEIAGAKTRGPDPKIAGS